MRAILFATFALTGASLCAAEPLETILARLDKSAAQSASFSASLKRTEYTAVLDLSEESSGVMRLKRTKAGTIGVVELQKPDARTLHFTGKTFEQYFPKANLLEVYDLGKQSKVLDRYLLLAFGLSGAELRKDYDVKATGEATVAGVKTTHLELVPRDKKALELISKVELWIPEGQTYAIQQKVIEPNRDYQTFVYSDAKVNPGLPDSAFDFAAPAGATKKAINK